MQIHVVVLEIQVETVMLLVMAELEHLHHKTELEEYLLFFVLEQ